MSGEREGKASEMARRMEDCGTLRGGWFCVVLVLVDVDDVDDWVLVLLLVLELVLIGRLR